jgi:hypothetical protein
MASFLLKVGCATCVVFMFTWLTIKATTAIIDACHGKSLRYSVRELLVYMTVIAVMLALFAGILQSPL